MVDSIYGAADITARSNRRHVVSLITNELSRTHREEEAYMKRIPLNMQGGDAYTAAEDCLEMLSDAILCLSEAY